MDSLDVQELENTLSKEFPIPSSSDVSENNRWEYFRNALIEAVLFTMRHQSARLPQILYRIDVNEALARKAFAGSKDEIQLAQALADLIIERQLQKLISRRKYKENSTKFDDANTD